MTRVLLLFGFCITMIPLSNAQEMTIRANLSAHTITDLDEGFVGGGLGLESTIGQHWSLGMDISWASSNDLSLFNFNPTVRYYFNRGLQGFYFGLGANLDRLSREEGPV
ncbi:MAG: DUF3575 domain-containing protein, partial [Saprospiraceae bacterium]|nr:DUF3575 domain-containing protein [Saprospiraceae bacterium]